MIGNRHASPVLLWLVALLFAVSAPCFITILLVAKFFNASLTSFVPATPTDEIAYWLMVHAFQRAGFGGGYFSYNENPPSAGVFHFGPHGPGFAMIYGALGRVFGWAAYSPPLFNMGILALAVVFYAWVGRLNWGQIVITGLLVATSFTVLLYILSSMEETFQQSLAFLLAALVGCLATRTKPSWGLFAVTVLVVLAASLMRGSWALLFGPVMFVGMRPSTARGRVMVTVSAILLIPIAWAGWRYVSAPVTGVVLTHATTTFWQFPLAGAMSQLHANIVSLIDDGANFLRNPLQPSVAYLVLLLVLSICGATLFRAVVADGVVRIRALDVVNVWNLGGILAAVLVFNIDQVEAYNRSLTPHVLFSVLLTNRLRNRPFLVIAMLIAQFALLPAALSSYRELRAPAFHVDAATFAEFGRVTKRYIRYDQSQGPWCNTVLMGEGYYPPQLVAIPAGIGVSVIVSPDSLRYPLSSEYLLLVPELYEPMREHIHVQPLSQTAFGTLYRNLDARCS